jgi:hypothetical protein
MIEEITWQENSVDWFRLLVEWIKSFRLKRNTQAKENYFLIE